MNYLAHLHLGGAEPEQLLGSLYGDFVKGRLKGMWPEPVEQAIWLHRRIDVFTDQHAIVERAKARFTQTQRRYSGILVDVFFDHCLACHWGQYANEPLPQFTQKVYQTLTHTPNLPESLARIAPHMVKHDWLGSYKEFAILDQVISGIAKRLSRPDALALGFAQMQELYAVLNQDFAHFYPELMAFAARERLKNQHICMGA